MGKGYTKYVGKGKVLMFVVLAAVLFILPLGSAQADIIKYGYTTPAPNIWPSVSANYLIGFAINVPEEMILTHVGIIDHPNCNANVKVGIYANNGGTPGALVAQTSPYHLGGAGDNLIPVDVAATLAAGNYWFMPVYETGALLTAPGDFYVSTKYASHPYASAIPAYYPSHSTYNGTPACYYLASDIPEPATMSLLAMGGLGLLLRRRKA